MFSMRKSTNEFIFEFCEMFLVSHAFILQGRSIEANLHRISVARYNDILSDFTREFAMQVYHERFDINANGFFHVNLNLLGSVNEI